MNYIIENKLITLNSNEGVKLNGEYLSQINFNFIDILKDEEDILYKELGLLSAEIPVSFYNINVNNQVLYYTINNIQYNLTIPEGNYNATNFITEFQTQFNNGGHTHTIVLTFSKITGKLTFTKSGIYDVIFNSINSTLYEVLGFLKDENYTISSTYTAPHLLNLLGVKKIKIKTNLSLHNYDSNGHTSGNLLHTLSVNKPSYSLIDYQNNHLGLNRIFNKIINEIHIEMRDENNNLIDFNNTYWTLTLILNIYRKFNPPLQTNINIDDIAINKDVNINDLIDEELIDNEIKPPPTKKELKVILSDLEKQNLEELELLLS